MGEQSPFISFYMTCLENLIDVWDGCSARITGVMYVNDIPGFTMAKANAFTTQEDQTDLQALKDCIRLASQEVENDVRSFVDPKVSMASVIDNAIIGQWAERRKVVPADTGYRGVRMEVAGGKHVALHIQSVTIFPVNAYVGDIKIFDLTQGIEIASIAVNLTGGQYNEVQIGQDFKVAGRVLDIAIAIDAAVTDVYQAEMKAGGCSTCSTSRLRMNSYVYAQPVSFQNVPPVLNDVTQQGVIAGMSINYQLFCDSADFICSISSRLKMAMFYRAGIKIMDEILFSSRLNSVTTVGRERAKELKNLYLSDYSTSMNNVVGNLSYPNNVCYNCAPRVQNITRIP